MFLDDEIEKKKANLCVQLIILLHVSMKYFIGLKVSQLPTNKKIFPVSNFLLKHILEDQAY